MINLTNAYKRKNIIKTCSKRIKKATQNKQEAKKIDPIYTLNSFRFHWIIEDAILLKTAHHITLKGNQSINRIPNELLSTVNNVFQLYKKKKKN